MTSMHTNARRCMRPKPKLLLLAVVLLWLPALPSVAATEPFSLELIEANPERGFYFPYYLRVPKTTNSKSMTLLVETNNTGSVNDDSSTHLASARALASGQGVSPFVATSLALPLLVPVFPRPKTSAELYTHALDRDTMLVHKGPLARLDLQLLAMIDDAHQRLRKKGRHVTEKFLMCGFSASGTFANRFAFIHPERLLGIAVGGINGVAMLPLREHGAHELIYPVGIGDLRTVSGKAFDITAWRGIPQLIFMGAADANDAVTFADAYSDEERELIYSSMGRAMQPDRWQAVQRIYLEEKARVTFVTYGGVGHWTNGRINQDVTNFLGAILLEQERQDEKKSLTKH